MSYQANGNRMLGFMVSSALTGVLLSGCALLGSGPASLAGGRSDATQAAAEADRAKAVTQAEAAVLADPRNADRRAALGAAYLDAGRFASAATSFQDAMTLGDSSPRTVLSLSLALTGQGRFADAALLLSEHEREIPIADLGLAYALAGQPGRGIHLMSNAIRGGENTAKMRQNLAFSYALAGRWREARLMAQQDVPPDQVSDRIEQWAMLAHPQAWQLRVASLLKVPANVADEGQPVHLALSSAPDAAEQVANAEPAGLPALTYADAPAPRIELPPLEPASAEAAPAAEPLAEPQTAGAGRFQAAFGAAAAAPAVRQDASSFAATPAAASKPAAPAAKPGPAAAREEATHLVQLGSFLSEQSARRAWDIYVSRYPELSNHRMVISEAVVKGKHYWRVSAAGFGRQGASAMCGKVKARGEGCFAYAEGRPLPGAIETGTRLARR